MANLIGLSFSDVIISCYFPGPGISCHYTIVLLLHYIKKKVIMSWHSCSEGWIYLFCLILVLSSADHGHIHAFYYLSSLIICHYFPVKYFKFYWHRGRRLIRLLMHTSRCWSFHGENIDYEQTHALMFLTTLLCVGSLYFVVQKRASPSLNMNMLKGSHDVTST